jgi:microcystin-dependent protein
MTEPFVGEIRMFAGNFAPSGWAYCDGQLLQVSQNDALFSLLGTIYGGDGRTTFGLPDLRGRLPIHHGSGLGLTPRPLGQKSGEENVTLNTNELPSHTHAMKASTAVGTQNNPAGEFLGASPTVRVFRPGAPAVPLNAASITSLGGSQNHTNLMPFLCINFIIALFGIYPSRN